jgi:putative methyltransferase (TIGR04325 family)
MTRTHEMNKSPLTRLGKMLELFIPPVVFKGVHFIQDRFGKPALEYAPDGWQTRLDNSRSQGWNVDSVIDTEKVKWDAFCRNLEGPAPLGFSHEHTDMSATRDPNFHNVHISYAYVLALTAHKKDRISVLDWGGALGHYYLIAKAVLPDVSIEYHVKEVPLMSKTGKQLNPEVHWYNDESCLERDYDLIMMNGSIGYMEDWADVLNRIANSVKEYLFLFRLLVVQNSPSFVAIQRLYNSMMLHQQLNQVELLDAVKETGLTIVREFVVGDRPYIKGAPEQCEMRGWLFKRETTSGL